MKWATDCIKVELIYFLSGKYEVHIPYLCRSLYENYINRLFPKFVSLVPQNTMNGERSRLNLSVATHHVYETIKLRP